MGGGEVKSKVQVKIQPTGSAEVKTYGKNEQHKCHDAIEAVGEKEEKSLREEYSELRDRHSVLVISGRESTAHWKSIKLP